VDQFFKSAQDAVDEGDLETALFYYEVFLVRYPEDHAKGIAAEYERALLHKKLGNKDLAKLEFREILNKYETSTFVILYPSRYKVLSEKVLADLEGEEVPEVDPNKYPARQIPEGQVQGPR
jgi:outer membrane protein assembly factor BamD (BamD/ComL family)